MLLRRCTFDPLIQLDEFLGAISESIDGLVAVCLGQQPLLDLRDEGEGVHVGGQRHDFSAVGQFDRAYSRGWGWGGGERVGEGGGLEGGEIGVGEGVRQRVGSRVGE